LDGQSQHLTGGAPAVPLLLAEIDLVACAEPIQFRDTDGAHDHGVGSQHPLQQRNGQAVPAEESFDVVQPDHAVPMVNNRLHHGLHRLACGGRDQAVVREYPTHRLVRTARLPRRRLAAKQHETARS
jgi:hypothetical protein